MAFPGSSPLPMKTRNINPPPLLDLTTLLRANLPSHFKNTTVTLTPCPNLTLPPFHLASPGLCGNESIADIGGPPYLHPLPDFTKKYSLSQIASLINLNPSKGFSEGFMLGAGAGPFHVVGQNSELMPNLSFISVAQDQIKHQEFKNLSRIAKIDGEGKCVVSPVPGESPDFALMANLFCCNGDPGEVLKITATHRLGKLNFTEAIQEVLRSAYPETVSLGGVFLIKRGKVMLHVMPDFCAERLEHDMMKDWLRFFEVDAEEVGGLVCLCTLHSRAVEGLDLRMEHTHCFSVDGMWGGHYHFDTSEEEVEYEGYFNTAKVVYRIDQPPSEG